MWVSPFKVSIVIGERGAMIEIEHIKRLCEQLQVEGAESDELVLSHLHNVGITMDQAGYNALTQSSRERLFLLVPRMLNELSQGEAVGPRLRKRCEKFCKTAYPSHIAAHAIDMLSVAAMLRHELIRCSDPSVQKGKLKLLLPYRR